MADDDNFDIDIYGDGGGYNGNDHVDIKQEGGDPDLVLDAPQPTSQPDNSADQNGASAETDSHVDSKQAPLANGDYTMNPQQNSSNGTPAPHGVKRKEFDDRQADSDATTALLISDLSWWTTDDDVRGWVNQANSEDELKDVTFSEHKVNGKSKGQAFVELTTPQAATATKHHIESLSASGRKYVIHYTNPHTNPFRTLPKDAPMRKDNNRSMSGGFNSGNQNMNFGGSGGMGMGSGGGFRGRGGYNNNRGMGGNMGNFNNRGNFNNMGGGFQGGGGPGMMGGFQGNAMGMQNYGFNNRGGMMGGMRGGPGGMRGRGGGNMGGMNPMAGGMGMNPMAGGMGMNPMAGGMNPMMGGMGGNMGMQGQGFQGPNPAFNQGFFNNQGGGGDASWNPHGAKRSRQE